MPDLSAIREEVVEISDCEITNHNTLTAYTIMVKKKDYGKGIPQHEIESLTLCLLPEIHRFFESEDGKREFEDWKAEQAKLKEKNK